VNTTKEEVIAAMRLTFDVATSYLLDNCPDGENWEDFDPEVDELRTKLDESLNEISA
jgi:hypothetical protein